MSAPERSSPPVLEMSRDYLGDRGRAQIAANQMTDLAAQLEQVRVVRAANADGADDPIPGFAPGPDGHVPSYAEREEHFTQAICRLEEAYSALMPLIEELLTSREGGTS